MAPRIPTATTHTPNTGHRPVQSPSMGTVTKTGPGVWPPGVPGTALVPLPRLPAKSRGLGLAADRSGSVLIPPRAPGSLFFSPELLPRSLQRLRPQAAETRHGRPPVDRRRPALQASGGHRTPHSLGCPTKGALPGADTRPPGNRARSPQHPACWPAQGWGRHPGLRS